MKKVMSGAIIIAITAIAMAANVPPSRTNPGNFPVATVPQFVCIGSDDNFYPDGFKWLIDYLRSKHNQTKTTPQAATYDGTVARMSFYVNTDNGGDPSSNNIASTSDASMKSLVTDFKQALADGHEIGDHTKTHSTGSTTSTAEWTREIDSALIDLNRVGISRDTVVGFRTPFLAYSDNTFQALAAIKQFRYDCSITSGDDDATDGTNFIWPYTLDNGPFAADTAFEPTLDTIIGGKATTLHFHAGHHPGLWEVPVYCAIVPPALRQKIKGQCVAVVNGTTYTSDFDQTTGKVSGMDYNLWSGPSNYGGLAFDSAEFVSTLKYSLDQRLAGNRAPMTFCVHSNIFYDTLGYIDEGNTEWNGPGAKSPKSTVTQMRYALAAFIDYALSRPEVRFVPAKELVKWCASPVAFNAPVTGTLHKGVFPMQNLNVRFTKGKVLISGLPAGGKTLVALFSLTGKRIAQTVATTAALAWKPDYFANSSYVLRLSGAGMEYTSLVVAE
jgi:hypothetical protein